MTANLFTLNSSKTEFLSVGLSQQLARIITHSARNLGFIFDGHLTFSDQKYLLSKKNLLTQISTLALAEINERIKLNSFL